MKNKIIKVDFIAGYKDYVIVFYENGFNRTYRFPRIPNTVENFIKSAKSETKQFGMTYTK